MIIALALGLIGLLLIYAEFFLPGGIMVIGGVLLLLISSTLFFFASPSLLYSLFYFIILIFLTAVLCRFALSRVKKGKIYLSKDQEGYLASKYDKNLIGKEGVCFSDLKPSGHIFVEEKKVQALSESGYLKKGEEVLILRGEGARYIVRKKP